MWSTLLAAVSKSSANTLTTFAAAVQYARAHCDKDSDMADYRRELFAAYKGSDTTFNQYWSELTRVSAKNLAKVARGTMSRDKVRAALARKVQTKSGKHGKDNSFSGSAARFFKAHVHTQKQVKRVMAMLKEYAATL